MLFLAIYRGLVYAILLPGLDGLALLVLANVVIFLIITWKSWDQWDEKRTLLSNGAEAGIESRYMGSRLRLNR